MSDQVSAAALAQAARLVARMVVAASSDLLEQLAQMPQENSTLVRPTSETLTVEITAVQMRPTRAGEDQRVELTCLQLGPVPGNPFMLWATVPAGAPNPYQVGQQYEIVLSRMPDR